MRSVIRINLNNLKQNYLTIKKSCNKEIIAVLKDNAYGHDLIHCAHTLSSLGVKMIAVATFEEALALRKNLIFTPILLFERCSSYRLLASYRISTSVQSLNHLKDLANSKFPLSIHLEIETGFNRLGIQEGEIDEAIDIINHSSLVLRGIFTHYASSKSYDDQNEVFHRVLEKFPSYKKLLIHSASSEYITKSDDYTNTIRVGLSLYGIHPELNLLPVMQIETTALRVIPCNKGDSVGYGHEEQCPDNGYLITLGIGYGDGWKTHYRTVAYQDKFYNQIGRSNMDVITLFSKSPIKELSTLELLGQHLTIKDLCSTYDVSSYDFYTSLSYRIKREYI